MLKNEKKYLNRHSIEQYTQVAKSTIKNHEGKVNWNYKEIPTRSATIKKTDKINVS